MQTLGIHTGNAANLAVIKPRPRPDYELPLNPPPVEDGDDWGGNYDEDPDREEDDCPGADEYDSDDDERASISPLPIASPILAGDEKILEIVRGLNLFVAHDQVVELRALDVEKGYRRVRVFSGYFDGEHLAEMARAAFDLSGRARGVYFSLNPVAPALLSRCSNRVDEARETTADQHIVRRYWLPLDLDPQRVAGVSASNDEKARAYERMQRMGLYLRGLGWPDPVVADSGNGYHLHYAIDLPTDDQGLTKRVLHALANRFDDDQVKIDRAVFNPARIIRLYGTRACKGDHTPERPHRFSSVLYVPPSRRVVTQQQLELLCNQAGLPAPPTTGDVSSGPVAVANLPNVLARAAACLDTIPRAISGQHGSNPTFQAACVLVKGFGLSIDEALPVLQRYNERCKPKWTEKELLHKLHDAVAQPGPVGYLLRDTGQQAQVASDFLSEIVDSETLDVATPAPRWLAKQILVADQLAVIGGPKKSLKTSIVADLAISLATATPFLGRFDVPAKLKVLCLSGESGRAAIRDTALRVCCARSLSLRDCGIQWGFQLPSLVNAVDMGQLTTLLIERQISVVICDPAYLCLLNGDAHGRQASNMFHVGPVLQNLARTCTAAGATPILVHHTRKPSVAGRSREFEPLDLEDLAYAGVAEFARQWILISRREKFDPAVGNHKLWLSVGGSAGHSGLHAVDVHEGVMDEAFGGREWRVLVMPADCARAAACRARHEEKQAEKARKHAASKEQLIKVMKTFTVGKTAPDIAEAAGIGEDKTRALLTELLNESQAFCTQVSKRFGSSSKLQAGWVLRRSVALSMNAEQHRRLQNGEPIEDVLGGDILTQWGIELPSQASTSAPEATEQRTPARSRGRRGPRGRRKKR